MNNRTLFSAVHSCLTLVIGIITFSHCISTRAEAPPAPANVQARITPSELLLTWEPSTGADYYKIYRGGPDRRWIPLPQKLLVPRFHETDFTVLPTYFQISACNAAGETATTEIVVNNATSDVDYYAHLVRQTSESSVTIAWYTLGSPSDAILEVGTGTNDGFFFAVDADYAQQHEFSVPNLIPNTTYWFRLVSTAANHAGVAYRNTFTLRPYTEPTEIPVTIVPAPPAAIEVEEDGFLKMLLTMDSPSNLPLQFNVTVPPLSGKLSGTPPHLTYTPGIATGFNKLDVFTCSVTDGETIASAQVFINIRARNHEPYAKDAAIVLQEDSGAPVPLKSLDLDNSPLQNVILSYPTNGTLMPKSIYEPGVYVYWPNTNFHGVDHITWAATDGLITGNVATIRVVVLPINDAPVVANQSATVVAGTPLNLALAASDPDGDFLSFSLISGPAYGFVGLSSGSATSVTYTTRPGITATSDQFTYQMSDGLLSTVGTVSITILIPGPPAAPSSLIASSPSSGEVNLAWSDNSWNEDVFVVERSNDNKSWKPIATLGANVGAFTDTGLSGNKSYAYRVKAANSLGASPYSNAVSLKAGH
jgi:hypothetical protein